MNARRSQPWRCVVIAGATLLTGLVAPGTAGTGEIELMIATGANTDQSGGGEMILVEPLNLSRSGVLLHEGELLTIECAEFRQERNGSQTFFAQARNNSTTLYLKLIGISPGPGLSSAMGGIEERQSTAGDCGAGLTPTAVKYTILAV